MKPVLDACCGSRMFWFDRQNPDVVFMDRREESHTLCDGRTMPREDRLSRLHEIANPQLTLF